MAGDQGDLGGRRLTVLDTMAPSDGLAFVTPLPNTVAPGDDMDNHRRSDLILLEDDRVIGPPHAAHSDIRELGAGRYSHWGEHLYFSTSDGSDPRTNGRCYRVLASGEREPGRRDRALSSLNSLSPDPNTHDAYVAVERALAILRPEAILGEDQKLFWTDRSFLAAFERLCGSNRRSAERKYTVFQFIMALAHVDGEMAECGVYNGGTAWFMAAAAERSDRRRALHLFDSFDGLSEPGDVDGNFWNRGSLRISEDEARNNLSAFPDIHVYKGWIPDRFDEVGDRRFAFVHVDVDLHAPTFASVSYFYQRLAPGGILLCDDYGFLTCPGATRAMDEVMAAKPERIIHLPTGQGLIIKQ
jgi:hypothetical protein